MSAINKNLLLVDDEENILRAIKRLCRRSGWNILTAGSGQEGLEILKENDVGVIISDQRMPEMNGVEFLSRVKNLYPDTVRIILSGYTDLASVTDAINRGAIYKFLTKPWDDDLLQENIEQAFKSYELVRENNRLTDELRQSNESLRRANQELESYAMLNFKVLQISQEILENLPIGIIGLGDDDIIAIANKKAHEMLSPEDFGLIGGFRKEMLPLQLNEFFDKGINEEGIRSWVGQLEGSHGMKVIVSPLGRSSISQGTVLAFIPEEESL